MGELLDKLNAFLESEEGQKSIEEWANKIKNEQAIKDSQLERAFKKYGLNIAGVVEKIVAKYDSDKYRDFWWNKGFEPPEHLYFFLFDYAAKYGVEVNENSPEEQQKCINMFTSDIYYLDGYVFNKINGQGTCVLVEKIN
jgi:hypothetical protein